MKTKIYRHIFQLLTLLLLTSTTLLNAQQLKLGNNPTTIQKSALLELESNSQGLLLPRISDTTLATIKNAPDGMIIFLTLNNSLCIRSGGLWHKLIPEGEALHSMNGSTVPVQTITATNNASPAALTTVGGNHFLNLPDASIAYSGFMGTGAQTFAGAKTFSGNLTAYQDLLLPNIIVDNTKDSVLLIDAGKVWKKRLTGLPPTGAAGGDLSGTYPSPVIAAGAITGAKMAQGGATTGQVLKWDGTTWAPAADDNTGTLSSVGLTATPAVFTVGNSPLTANGAIALGLQTQTANTVFAGPGTGAAAVPTFRALVAGDIPALPFSKITGVVPVAQGGTALNAVGANGTFLASNGTALAYRTLAAADIPSLPFSKITGVVPIAQGGTGLSSPGTTGYLLVSTGTGLTYMDPVLGGDVINNAFANSIAPKAVTYAKMQDVTTQKILGRYAATNGSTQEISLDNSLKLTTAGTLYADSSLPVWNASKFLGRSISPLAPATGQVLKYNGTAWAPAVDDNTGSLSSVGLTAPGIFTVTNSPLTTNGAIALGLQTQTANTVFAGPGTGAAAAPGFRTLVAGDIPALPFSNITGVVPVAQGGTNLTVVGAAGTFLTSNGTAMAYRTLSATDIPALPFSNITGVVPVAQGGTNLTAVGAAGTVLTSNGSSLTYAAPAVTLAGDVTGANGTNTIAAGVVTYTKMQNVTSQKLLGRYAATAGSTQEVSLDNSLKLTTAGTMYADSSLAIWNASKLLGRTLSPLAPASGQVLKYNGTTWEPAADNNSSGLSSVGLTMPSIFAVSGSPLVANGTITATLQNQTANTFFAGPGTGAAAAPAFRSMVTADIPDQGVTYAKMQNVTSQKLLGRYAATAGSAQEVTLDNSLKLTTAGTMYADSSLDIWNAAKIQGLRVSPKAPASGEVLKWNGSSWESNTDNDGGATYGTVDATNDAATADVAGSTTRMKIWNSGTTGTVVNGPAGTIAYAWSILAFRGNNYTTHLYFDKNTLAVKEWGGNTASLTTNAGNGWYKMITTNGNTNIANGSIVFGYKTSDATSEVSQDNANLFWDNTNKSLGIGTNTPVASLSVNGGMSLAIKSITANYTVTDDDYTIVRTTTTATNHTITLPSAAGRTGRIFIIKRVSASGTVTINGGGGTSTIEGAASVILPATAGKAYTVQSNGTVWYVISGI